MTNCNFCHKKGLLIYPVRYAVASPYGADGVPGLSGNFRIEDAPQAAGAAKYTLRALRPGYLYTYDERRQRLKAYVVLPTGHLWNYPLEYNAPHPSTIRFACIEASEVVRAYCVDIEHTDADPAGNFWIGWSNVQWTRTLIKKVSDASWRKKHMRCIAIRIYLYLLSDGKIKASSTRTIDIARWAITQAKERGIKLDTTRRQTHTGALAEASRAVNQAKKDRKVIAYELDIARLEKEGRIVPGSIKGIGLPGVATAQKWLGSSSPSEFRLGAATILVQMVALNFAMKDLANNDQFNQTETRFKAAIAIASLSATIVETVAISVEKTLEHPLGAFIRRQWTNSEKFAAGIAKAARIVGAIAGIFAGLYDIFVNAPAADKAGNQLLSQLYSINGFLGALFPIAIYFAIGAIFWALLVFSFGVGIAIAMVNDSALKSWISRCEFSVGEHYKSFEEQINAYHNAVGV